MRALALFSGGLDSMLAIKLVAMQGIEVIALNMNTGFGSTKDQNSIFEERAKKAGATLKVVDIREKFIKEVLFSPKYGYGKRFNPCIDCHGFMFKIAKEMLSELDANFIITGEVLGQRPMSQNKTSLSNVLKLSRDSENIILRPLSAKLLEPTKPEIEGWIDREKLLDISGRDRKKQFELAKEFGFEEYQTPSGGCLLTEEFFSKKLREFTEFKSLNIEDIELLKVGRHFRLPHKAKLILGRNEEENNALERTKNNDYLDIFLDEDIPAPFGRISQDANGEDKILSAKILLSFTKLEKEKTYLVKIGNETLYINNDLQKSEAKSYSLNEK